MFRWFEQRLDPYPADPPQMPPSGLWRFILHFSRGAKGYMLAMAACSAMIAVAEVVLFGYLGQLVDRLSGADRSGFWAAEGSRLVVMGAILMIGLPVLQVLFSLIMHQTLMGNMPQRIRWQAHRYLLRQSMSYFQDEFAGRIATKLMQTALAVREVAMKFMDVLVYVSVYFIGALILAASTDGWLALPFLGWGILYGLLLWWIIPRIAHISEAQADARAVMTGRVVDSYTNISTVKLFSHSSREEAYVRESMENFLTTVHGQMRLASVQNILLSTLNSALTFSVTALGLWLWTSGKVEVGAVAVAVPLALRLGNMSHWIMWEFAGLFENIGTVRDGIGSLALPRMVTDARGAAVLKTDRGGVDFDRAVADMLKQRFLAANPGAKINESSLGELNSKAQQLKMSLSNGARSLIKVASLPSCAVCSCATHSRSRRPALYWMVAMRTASLRSAAAFWSSGSCSASRRSFARLFSTSRKAVSTAAP